MLSSPIKHRYLFLQMLKREIEGRYRGSQLGVIWAFVYPILMLLVYTFVFGVVMKVKWGVHGQDNLEFGIILFAGLILHSFLAEVFMGSVGVITGNQQYVKKVVFPLELLSCVNVANALVHMLLSFAVLLCVYFLTGGVLHWTLLLAPIVVLPFVLFLLGASWCIAVLGVYMRDLSQLMGVLITILLFLCPIVYPFSAVPQAIQFYVLWFNPLTIVIEQFRAVVLFGAMPNWSYLAVYYGCAIAMLMLGRWFFMKTRDGFADVI